MKPKVYSGTDKTPEFYSTNSPKDSLNFRHIQILENNINDLTKKLLICQAKNPEPTLIYETLRRKVIANIRLFWEQFQFIAENLTKTTNLTVEVEKIVKTVREYKM